MRFHRYSFIALWIVSSVAAQSSLTGTVKKADGTPVSGIQVVLQDTLNMELAHTTTDDAGAYTIPVSASLTTCNIMVRVNSMMTVTTPGIPKEVYYTAFTKVPLSGTTTKDITLPRYYRMSGTVVDENGNGIAGAQLTAKKWNGFESTPHDNCQSLPNGVYELFQEAGGVKIWVVAPSGFTNIEPQFTISSDTVIQLTLPKPIAIHGTVRTYAGVPAGNAIVCVQQGMTQIDSLARSDGTYNIPLQAGTYKIRLRSNSMNRVAFAPIEFDTTVIEGLVVTRDTLLDLTLQRFYRVALLIQDNQSAPIPRAQVRSVKGTGIGQLPRDMAQTDALGRCTVYVTGGSSEITITPEPGPFFEYIAPHTLTSDTVLTLTLPKGAKFSGRVLRADSIPVKGITLALQTLTGPTQYEVLTDTLGSFLKHVQPGAYKVRVRNFSCPGNAEGRSPIPGIPCDLEYTAIDSVSVSDSVSGDIVLPVFPLLTGIVKNSSGVPIQGTRIYSRFWRYGYEQPPHDEAYSTVNGTYQLALGQGINRIWVVPPVSQPTLQAFDFVDNFDSNRIRDIIIPDQARGITRIQPSVISTGKTGSVMINGININFSSDDVSVDLGPGITVSDIKVISGITITAGIDVADSAATGSRDVLVRIGTQSAVGAGLLTITAPAWGRVDLVNGESVRDVRISDGTGTEILIPAGTAITFPPGSDSIIRFSAPLIAGADTAKPVGGEFTAIQRELRPSGLVVGAGDSIVVTSRYKDQDVVGLNEETLAPFYFIDTAGSGGSTRVGESMTILARDTTRNTITFSMGHFSMFRLARIKEQSVKGKRPVFVSADMKTCIAACPNPLRSTSRITVRIAPNQANALLNLSLFTLKGERIGAFSGRLGAGMHTFSIKDISAGIPARGTYVLKLQVGKVVQTRRLTITR